MIKVLRLLAPRPVHVAAIRKNNDAECKLLSDIMAEGPSWSRIAPKKTDRTKNKTKQTKHKIGFINECNAFFLHFPFLISSFFHLSKRPNQVPSIMLNKKKIRKKIRHRTGFRDMVRNLFESNKNDLHIKLASHQVPVSFQTRTSLLLLSFFFWIVYCTHERAFFIDRLLPGLSWFLTFISWLCLFPSQVENGLMPKPIVFPHHVLYIDHIV